jgi:hypothetical protein
VGVAACATYSRSSSNSKMPECQSGDAGASPADRTIFQNPTIETHEVYGGRQLAQLGLQNLAGSGRHRDAVPLSNRAGARWEGSGLISRLRAGSIPAHATSFPWAARSLRRSLASQAGTRARMHIITRRSARRMAAGAAKHGAKPWRSTTFSHS